MIKLEIANIWTRLRKNPDLAYDLSLTKLETIIVQAKDRYYNSEKPLLTDKQYDQVEDILKERSPRSKALSVGAAPIGEKVRLPYYLGSLNKIKDPKSLDRWLSRSDCDLVTMDKLDGQSFLYTGTHLYTRGNGREGRDISTLIPIIGLPKLGSGQAVRGELIIPRSLFKRWDTQFSNPRNMVSGLTNRKDIHPAVKHIEAVAYEFIGQGKPSQQLKRLKSKGFKIPFWTLWEDLYFDDLVEELADRRSKSKYEIDGLVIITDEAHRRNTDKNPSYSVAFKQEKTDQAPIAKVISVHWRESRFGVLKPRIEIEPTVIDGSTIRYATAHNAQYIKENKIGPGSMVRILKGGDIIPKIIEVVKATRPQMPLVDYEWSGVDIVCLEKTDETQIRAAEFFFSTLGVEGLKYGSIKKLFDYDYDLIDIIHLDEEQLVEVLGRNGIKINKSLDVCLDAPYLDQLMAASGTFQRGLGLTKLTTLVNQIPNIMEISKKEALPKLQSLPLWSGKTIDLFCQGFPLFKKFLKQCDLDYTIPNEPEGDSLSGEVIVFTGLRDKELENIIKQEGGQVGNSVTKNTTMVINKDGTSSSKTKKAEELGITCLTVNQFKKRYL